MTLKQAGSVSVDLPGEDRAMDMEEETATFKVALLVIVLFIISTAMSCRELRYSISGEVTQGRFTGIQEYRVRGKTIILKYEFTDSEGTVRKGSVWVSPARAAALFDTTPEVIYLPSSPETNTLTGQRSIVWPIIFAVMLIVLVVTFYRLHREAHGLDRRR